MANNFFRLTTFLLILTAWSSHRSVAQAPAITYFSPASDSIGATVTIFGTNFNPIASNDVVFFGVVKAMVNAASPESVIVTVPVGATYAPITLTDTTNGLTAYSSASFDVTFSGSHVIDSSSFEEKVDLPAAGNQGSVGIGDLDGDGNLDILNVAYLNDSILVFRNSTTFGSITSWSLAPQVGFTTGSTPNAMALGDVDGDGKPDIIAVNEAGNTVSVLRNTSTSGSITAESFAAKVDFATGTAPFAVAIGDIDGDGKPDIIVSNYDGNTISIFRNASTIGNISFTAKVDFSTGTNPYFVAIDDLDGDGKPDVVVISTNSGAVSVFRNTSSTGSIDNSSFAVRQDFITGTEPYGLAIGDIDGDGKPDLIVPNPVTDNVMVLRNTSTSGNISFAAQVNFTTGSYPQGVAIGDMDGDGKPDIIVGNNISNSISVFRNTSTMGSIDASSFANKVDFATGTTPFGVAIGDMNGDGRPDIVVSNVNSNTISVFISPQNYVQFDTSGTPPTSVSATTHTNTNPDDLGGQWEIVPSIIDTIAHIVTADSVTHFSTWAIGISRPGLLQSKTTGGGDSVSFVRRVYSIAAEGGKGFNARLVLKYNTSEVPPGTFEDSLTLLRLIPGTSSISLHDAKGWNLISVPELVSNYSTNALYPGSNSSAYGYLNGYHAVDTLANGAGYWVRFPSAGSVQMTGTYVEQETVAVVARWNMIGVPAYPVLTANVAAIGTTLYPTFYGYSSENGYHPTDTLMPGQGYWVKVTTAGKLFLPSGASMIPRTTLQAQIRMKTAHRENAVDNASDGFSELVVRDGRGKEKTLFFCRSRSNINLDDYELPPVPPFGLFDVRYSSQRSLEVSDKDNVKDTPILLSTDVSYPVTIQWKIDSAQDDAVLLVDGKPIQMTGTGETQIGDNYGYRTTGVIWRLQLRLSPLSAEGLPNKFALYQNYPNPFNPTTKIKYDLSEDARVTIKIYNVLGQEILKLVDGVQNAGYRSAVWNASGCASGVYFCRLDATSRSDTRRSYSQVRKMVLMR